MESKAHTKNTKHQEPQDEAIQKITSVSTSVGQSKLTNEDPKLLKSKDKIDQEISLAFDYTKFVIGNQLPFTILNFLSNFVRETISKYKPE